MAVQHYKTRMALNSKNEVNTVSMPKMTVRDHGIIRLGKQGENEVLQVIWRGIVPEWEEKYGAGEFQLAVRRNQDTAPYIANIELDGGDIVWTITSAETARVGDGECELTYTVGDSIAKSQIWTITVCESLTGQEPVDPPEPAKNWVDVVIKSSSDAKQSATESAESAKQAAASREAIENMEAAAVSLPTNSKATVEKDLADGKVKLTFGIPRGESDIFWLNTTSSDGIAETFDEIVAAYEADKNIWIRDTHSFNGVVTMPSFLVLPFYDDNGNNINGILIICSGTARGSSGIGTADTPINATYYIIYDPTDPSPEVVFDLKISLIGEIADGSTPSESQLNGFAGSNFTASPDDHIHPAPFPDWTNNVGKALFVNNANETPSEAFEWRDVPNGDFNSKVGDFLKVVEVDSSNKPTKWTTDSIGGTKEPMIVTFTLKDPSTFSFKADTLYDDIKEAANAGRIVYAFAPASSGGPLFARLVAARSTLVFSGQTNVNAAMIIKMSSDSDIYGTGINLLYCRDEIFGGGDFNAGKRRIKGVEEPTDDSDAATKGYVDKSLGSSDHSLGITDAQIGKIAKITAVDKTGKPTKWEPVDIPSGGADISLGLTTATIGQTIKVKAIDTEGKPTAWEAVDAPSGGGAIDDVQINGNSIVGVNGVAEIPKLQISPLKNPSYGLPTLANGNTPVGIGLHIYGSLMTIPAKRNDITNREEKNYFDLGSTGSDYHMPICPGYLDYSVKAAMCDGKGAAWTDVERIAALLRMGCTIDDNGFVKWTAQEVTE